MILQLISDRRRLTADADEAARGRCLIEQARFAVSAGVDMIQLREPDLEGCALTRLARELVSIARGSRTRVIVNDRLDVALAAGADGVHLRGNSFEAARVRRSCRPAFLIGRSVRTPSEAAAAGPVDYLVAGTVFATPSKPASQALLRTSGLTEIVRASEVPVLAIGGLRPELAGEVAGCGAAGIAAIGVWMGEGAGCRAVPLIDLVEAFRRTFETVNMKADVPPVR
jgi:thiamine-phosphate pyrophosphorylase